MVPAARIKRLYTADEFLRVYSRDAIIPFSARVRRIRGVLVRQLAVLVNPETNENRLVAVRVATLSELRFAVENAADACTDSTPLHEALMVSGHALWLAASVARPDQDPSLRRALACLKQSPGAPKEPHLDKNLVFRQRLVLYLDYASRIYLSSELPEQASAPNDSGREAFARFAPEDREFRLLAACEFVTTKLREDFPSLAFNLPLDALGVTLIAFAESATRKPGQSKWKAVADLLQAITGTRLSAQTIRADADNMPEEWKEMVVDVGFHNNCGKYPALPRMRRAVPKRHAADKTTGRRRRPDGTTGARRAR